MKLSTSVIKPNDPLLLHINEEDIHLIKGLNNGTLDAEEQKQAFDILVTKFCRVGTISLDPDPHKFGASEGMRLVGAHLLHIARTPFDKLLEEEP